MSCQTRQQRFASPMISLSEEHLDYLTNLDGVDRVAWCACIQTDLGERGIGLARYFTLVNKKQVAEFAVTVVDEFQGQGVGTELMKKLVETAKSNSVEILRGFVLPSNRVMLALCRRFDAETVREDASTMRADIRIKG
jgi:acetyltransferase